MFTVFQTFEKTSKVDVIVELTTQLDTALEVARFAKLQGADEETILAALLLDIGLYCPSPEQWGDNPSKSLISYKLAGTAENSSAIDCGRLGADYLRKFGFPIGRVS